MFAKQFDCFGIQPGDRKAKKMKKKFVPRSETTRQRIIEQTAHIFNKKGFTGTSLTDLTEATRLTKGGIYGNFENKYEVALEAFKYNCAELSKRIYAYVSREKTALGQLFSITRFYRDDFNVMKYVGGCPLLNAAIDVDDTNEEMRGQVIQAFQQVIGTISNIIEKGKKSREISEKADSSKYAALFFSLLEGGILLSKTTNKRAYLCEACDRIDVIIKQELQN